MAGKARAYPEIDALDVARRGLSQRGAISLNIHEVVALSLFARQMAGALEDIVALCERNGTGVWPYDANDLLAILRRHQVYTPAPPCLPHSNHQEIPHGPQEPKA